MDSGLPFGTGAPSRRITLLTLPRWHWHILSEIKQRRPTDAVICSKNVPDSWLIGLATAASLANQLLSFPYAGATADSLADAAFSTASAYTAKRRMAAMLCGLNGSTQHPYKTTPPGFRSRGSYKAVQSAGAATNSG